MGRESTSCLGDFLGDDPVDKPSFWIVPLSRNSELCRASRMFFVVRLTNNLAAISLRKIHGSYTASCVLKEFEFCEFSLHFPMRGHEMAKNKSFPLNIPH